MVGAPHKYKLNMIIVRRIVSSGILEFRANPQLIVMIPTKCERGRYPLLIDLSVLVCHWALCDTLAICLLCIIINVLSHLVLYSFNTILHLSTQCMEIVIFFYYTRYLVTVTSTVV